jgi:hypothetical protein
MTGLELLILEALPFSSYVLHFALLSPLLQPLKPSYRPLPASSSLKNSHCPFWIPHSKLQDLLRGVSHANYALQYGCTYNRAVSRICIVPEGQTDDHSIVS